MLRRSSIGRSLAVAWMFGGFVVQMVPSSTRPGPFA
jgi:hypothetical protein